MQDAQRLTVIRTVHTAIYVTMVGAICIVLFAGVTGRSGFWLWVALLLLVAESIVFAGNGFRCPLTSIARRYGARTGHVFDTFLPEWVTKRTFAVFGSLWGLGLLLLVFRWLGVLA